MTATARRVALLARPGIACDRLRGALADAGAEVVLEADPLTLDPATLEAAQAQVLLVALDTQTEEALDRFEEALLNPSIEVIFEEADLAASREGWEAARWARHLAAKLHRHGDVLPPGSESADDTVRDGHYTSGPQTWPGMALASEGAAEFPFGETPVQTQAGIDAPHPFDPLFAEIDFDDEAPPAAADFAAGDGLAIPESPGFDPSLDFTYDGSFDPIAPMISSEADDISRFDSSIGLQDDALPIDAASVPTFSGEDREAPRDPGFDLMFDGDFAAIAATAADGPGGLEAPDGPAADDVEHGLHGRKMELELVSADDQGLHAADDSAAGHRFKHDLASLDARIAGMELVDDRLTKGPAQANGAVLVMAGIGGPDAVRQLLGALPEDFPRPVLVQQRLDGGRYDKLVAQMQRATAMRVKLAEPGLPAIAGVVYIVPSDVCIHVAEAGIQFVGGGDDILAALPSADSAILLLSGSDALHVDAVMKHSWAGALVIGQSPDGCYDPAAPNALLARGGGSAQPAELAERLTERWRS